jgi:hypothetical protein
MKIYFAECQKKTLGKEVFAECLPGDNRQRFLNIKTVFVECLSVGTRQRRLCRVPDCRHSTKYIFKLKKSLSSARSRALGKDDELNNSVHMLRPFLFLHRRRLPRLSPAVVAHATPCHPGHHRRLPCRRRPRHDALPLATTVVSPAAPPTSPPPRAPSPRVLPSEARPQPPPLPMLVPKTRYFLQCLYFASFYLYNACILLVFTCTK